MNKIQKQAAISCFKTNEGLNEVIVTQDGNCFTSVNLSQNHEREARLDKNQTVTITRDMVDMVTSSNEADGGQPAAKPFAKMNKAELVEAAAKLNIEVPDGATNKDIIALLEAKNTPEGERGEQQ